MEEVILISNDIDAQKSAICIQSLLIVPEVNCCLDLVIDVIVFSCLIF